MYAIFSVTCLEVATHTHVPTVLVRIHRTFFARALADYPDDPLLSEYASSVHAVLRGARDALQWLSSLMDANANSCARLHYVWTSSFAAVVSFAHHHRHCTVDDD
jgi:hypothetical protein